VTKNLPCRTVVVLLGLWLATSPCHLVTLSQERPADNAVASQINEGVEKARDGKLLDAVEQFQRVLDTSGDELVPVDQFQYAPARWVIHGHFSRLPADGLRLYRQRVDGQAAKRLEEAKKSRHDADLQRLLADMFVASASEEAILELARRAFERGEFDAAEHYWQLLLPPEEGSTELRFPRPKTEVAAVKARLLLVKLFRGDRDEAKSDMKAFREKHADAAGLLAGKTGKYVDTLTDLLNDPAKTTLPRLPDEAGWLTFAGSPSRLGTLRTRLPYFWPDVPAWKASLPFVQVGRLDRPPPDVLHPRSLAFQPVISDGRAYVSDGTRVVGFDLMSGKSSRVVAIAGGEDARIPTKQDVRYTLTEHDGILYARFGPSALKAEGASFIVALGSRKGNTEEREVLWRLDPPAGGDGKTQFEGTPIVHRDRHYVGIWREAVGEGMAGIACYRIDDPKAAPELVWQRIVGKAGTEPNGETRYRHALVAISGPNVVYCTDGGTVIALDATTGKPAWEYRYPRNERPTLPRYRDLCPPLADGGRIYAAPADTDRLLCLDAYTGRLIWEREGVEVVHLLGVSRGRLIATFAGQVKGIRGLNLRTGADSRENGWTIHDDGGEATFGRGLVTEEAIVWPTKHGLHFLNPVDGSPLRSPIPGPFGNLCYADGVLLVTTATEVWGFVTEAKKLDDRRKAIEKEPDNPALHAELTQSLIDAGEYAEAEKEAANAGDAKERLLWLLAERVIREGDKGQAKRVYGDLLAKGNRSSFAAAGAVRLAEMCEEKEKLRDIWQAVAFQRGTIRDEHGIPYPPRNYAGLKSPESLVDPDTKPTQKPPTEVITISPRVLDPPRIGAFSRTSWSEFDDSSLRILNAGAQGVIAAGRRIRLFPDDHEFGPLWQPSAASLFRWASTLTFVTPYCIVCLSTKDGMICGYVDPQTSSPILSRIDCPPYPSVSGNDGSDTIENPVLDEIGGVSYVHEGRAIVYVNPFFAFGVVRMSPYTHTAHIRPRFSLNEFMLAQRSDGRLLIWDEPELPPRDYPGSQKPWREAPPAIGDTKFLIPDDPSVFLFDAKAGKELARYSIPGGDSLTGELPRFRIHQGDPLLLIDRNHGVEVDRLKIDGLKRAWTREPILVGRELDDVAFAGERFFTVADGTLAAHFWKDGILAWDMPLPDSPQSKWKVTVSPQGLLVHPSGALQLKPDFDLAGELRDGWNAQRLLVAVLKSYHVWSARELPILVIDPADGRLIQRLNFPAAGPAAGVAVTPKGVVVVTGKGSWTLNADTRPR
jgi:PQQ-like domain